MWSSVMNNELRDIIRNWKTFKDIAYQIQMAKKKAAIFTIVTDSLIISLFYPRYIYFSAHASIIIQ